MSEFSIYDELMPKIQSLISPSDYGNKEKSASDQHPFYKKRGRRHNHDHCDACGEKGNLLCCEICPASFHLLCHDPPLVGKNLPSDTWHCRACNIIMGKNMAHLVDSLKNKQNSNGSNRNVEIRIPEMSHMQNRVRNTFVEERDKVRVDSCTNDLYDAEMKSEKSDGMQPSSEYEINSFIHIRNEESSTQYIVNGNSDIEIIEIKSESTSCDECSNGAMKNTSNESKDLHKFTNVSINLPKCDNLLNSTGLMHASTDPSFNQIKKPPSTSVMSINEVFAEVIKEAKKMNPKQFALPIEYITNINLNVIGSEKDPDTFRNDVDSNDLLKLPPRRCFYCNGICLTGEMISCDFCPAHFHLNCLNPPLCSVADVRWMCPLHPHHILDKIMKNSSSITEFSSWWNKLSVPVDDENVKIDFISRVKAVQKKPSLQSTTETAMNIPEIVKYYYKNPSTKIPTTKNLLDSTQICVFDSDFILTPHDVISKSNDCCDEIKVRETTPFMGTSRVNEGACITVKDINENDFDLDPVSSGSLIEIISDDVNTKTCGVSNGKEKNECSEDLSTWDKKSRRFRFKSNGIYDYESLVKTNIERRISPDNFTRNKVVHESVPVIMRQDSCKGNPWQRIRQIVNRDLEDNFRLCGSIRSRIDPRIKKYMIEQKMNMLVRNLCPSLLPNTLPYPFFSPRSDDGHWQLLPDPPKRKVRAVLCPLSHRAPLIYMYRSTLNIGTDFSNDVCLVNYGRCNFGSREHAVIYYDKITNMYELLNYSEYGTFVDGLCYCCNWASKDSVEKNNINFTNNEERRDKTITDTDNQTFDEDGNDSEMNWAAERKTRDRSVGSDDGIEVKRTGSAVAAVETRNTYKKLLQDIDKLVVKSQKEMTSIADDDLNEISKLIKLGREALNSQRESSVEKSKLKKKPEPFSSTIKKRKTLAKTADSDCVMLVDDPPADEIDLVTDQTKKRSGEVVDGAPSLMKRPRRVSNVPFKIESVESIGIKENSIMRRFRRPKHVFANRRPRAEKRADTNNHNQVNEETLSSESDRDFEYMGEMKGNGGEKKCRCQLLNLKLPIGRDSSWERAAPLHHGSYIRFGCLEFIFSIINYPAPFGERINKERLKTRSPSPVETIKERKATSPPRELSKPKTSDDLSTKLISILNVLSTPRSSRSSLSGTPETSDSSGRSSRSSPMSSRSISPVQSANGIAKINHVFEINHERLE